MTRQPDQTLYSLLSAGICTRIIAGVNGLAMHVLEAGHEEAGRPLVLLIHGFPDLAFSWRKVMLPLAAAGFHVVAPDQHGYGRTAEDAIDDDAGLAPYRILNLVRDMVAMLGRKSVAGVVGYDSGAALAVACALVRLDLFRTIAIMSAPFTEPAARIVQ